MLQPQTDPARPLLMKKQYLEPSHKWKTSPEDWHSPRDKPGTAPVPNAFGAGSRSQENDRSSPAAAGRKKPSVVPMGLNKEEYVIPSVKNAGLLSIRAGIL